MQTGEGVVIGNREIYDKLQDVDVGVRTLNDRMARMEELPPKIERADERSREAHEIAKDALALAKRNDASLTWLWRTVGAAVIVAIIGASIHFGSK